MRLLFTLATFGIFSATVHAQFHGQFENVRPVPGLSSPYRDIAPFVTEDGRTIHFQSDRDSSADPVDWTKMNIWTATRNSTSEPFGEPVMIDGPINTDERGQNNPSVVQGGTALYFFTGSWTGTGDGQSFVSQKVSDTEWGAPQLVEGINDAERDIFVTHVSEDAKTLYFNLSIDGTRNYSIFRASRDSTLEPFGNTTLLDGVSTEQFTEDAARESSDVSLLLFATNRGPAGFHELWGAVRSSTNEPFTNPMDVNELGLGELNAGNTAEFSPYVSPDWPAHGSKIYFARAFVETDWDIMEATWVVDLATDFSGDGNVGVEDIDVLVAKIVAGTDGELFDLTGSGVADDMDVNQWLSEAATHNGFSQAYLPGDSNLDGSVDATDLNNLALNWRKDEDVAAWSA